MAVCTFHRQKKLLHPIKAPDIHFIDANTGYVCTNKSIFATSDGGANWTKVVTMANDYLTEIHFIDRDHGWACGSKGSILIFKKIARFTVGPIAAQVSANEFS